MPSYTLTGPQAQIVVSWLYEADGYLDGAVNVSGVSARQALAADPTLDVTEWIRTETPHATTDHGNWEQCGMLWWIRVNDRVNITPGTRPPETAAWVTTLQTWLTSIEEGLANVSEVTRNQSSQSITAVDGTVTSMPAGAHLRQQQLMIGNVLGVLT